MKNVKPAKFLVLDLADGEYRFCDTADEAIEQIDEIICETDYDYVEENIKVYGITEEFQVKYGKAYLVKKGTDV